LKKRVAADSDEDNRETLEGLFDDDEKEIMRLEKGKDKMYPREKGHKKNDVNAKSIDLGDSDSESDHGFLFDFLPLNKFKKREYLFF